jgi:hypothetical protein
MTSASSDADADGVEIVAADAVEPLETPDADVDDEEEGDAAEEEGIGRPTSNRK